MKVITVIVAVQGQVTRTLRAHLHEIRNLKPV